MTIFPNNRHNQLIAPGYRYVYKPVRYVATSRAGRRHLIGADIISAVHTGFENVEGTHKARKRLGELLSRLQCTLGDRSPDGGWRFRTHSEFRQYQRSLQGLLAIVNAMPARTDGLCWLIVGLGWSTDLHVEAKEFGRDDLALAWRPIMNLLDGLFRSYEGEEWADASWEPGKELYERLKSASASW
jgi:hypothetical protein